MPINFSSITIKPEEKVKNKTNGLSFNELRAKLQADNEPKKPIDLAEKKRVIVPEIPFDAPLKEQIAKNKTSSFLDDMFTLDN